MNETDSLDVLSDSYIIAENISVFKRAVHEGAPVQLVSIQGVREVEEAGAGLLFQKQTEVLPDGVLGDAPQAGIR